MARVKRCRKCRNRVKSWRTYCWRHEPKVPAGVAAFDRAIKEIYAKKA